MFLVQLFWAKMLSVLHFCNNEAARDIVQFVELSQFLSDTGGWSKESLARAVLAEVPGQVSFFSATKLMQGCKWLTSANSKHSLRSRDAHLKIFR